MKKIASLFIFIMLLFMCKAVYGAGSVSLSSNKSSVTVGEEFTVSINFSGAEVASLTARITVDTSKVEYVSGTSNSNFSNGRVIYTWTDPNGGANPIKGGTIATFKFRAKSAGSSGFSVSGDFYSPEETALLPTFSGTTVNISEKVQEAPQNPPQEQKPQTPSGSQTPNSSQTPNDSQTQSDSQTQTNPQTSQQPSQAQAPSGGQSQNLSGNNNLRSLELDIEGLTPNFDKNITEYSLIVPETIIDIDVLAAPEDSSARVSVTGNNGLQMGANTISIIVTAQNGNQKTYRISVSKTEDARRSNSLLENLSVENMMLVPEFRADITQYSLDVGSEIESLNILAVPQEETAIVTIEGNENFAVGENNVTVLVTAEDGITTTQYNIKVNKKSKEEEEAEASSNNEDMQKNEKQDKTIDNIIISVVAILGVCGIIYMTIKKK